MNAIMIIAPYKYHGIWVFDDPDADLIREPFVSGADRMLDRVTNGADNCLVLFSDHEFPGHQYVLHWKAHVGGGDVYHEPSLGMDGWLCPALLEYFEVAPSKIFIQIKQEEINVN